MKKFCNLLVGNMAFLVIGASVLGALVPGTLTWVGPHVALMLGIVMFGMGMTLTVDDFRELMRRPWEVGIGVFAQFLIMPLIAYGLAKLFALPPELAAGVLLVGCCPGGTASNVISYLAKGDVALSVSMTMVTTLLAPIVTPALMFLLAGAWIDISFSSMMLSIAQMVLLPVLLGLAAHHFFEKATERVMPAMPLVSVISIVLLVGGVVALSAEKLWDVGPLMAAVVVLHNLLGLLLGYILAAKLFRMGSKKSRTVSIEVGMQNSGMAASLALLYFGPASAIAGAIFSCWHNISGSLVANFFAKRDERSTHRLETARDL